MPGRVPPGRRGVPQQCEIDHPAGTANEVSALSACLVTHCESDCGLACGALAGWAVEPDAAAAFQSRMTGSREQERACAGSAGCDAVTRCYVACPTPDCITTCVASRGVDPGWCFADAGATDASSTSTGFARAASACASVSGNYWECVGHVSWPPVQAATTTLQNRVTDSSSGMTISGMKVEACGTEDIECNAPWAVDYTDSSGWVSMQVPLLPASSTAGYLKVTLAPMTSSASVRTYGYWGFPLSQARCVDYSCDLGVNVLGLCHAGGDPDAREHPCPGGVRHRRDGRSEPRHCRGRRGRLPAAPGSGSRGDVEHRRFAHRRGEHDELCAFRPHYRQQRGNRLRFRASRACDGCTAFPTPGKPSGKVDVTVRAGPDFPLTAVYVPVTPLVAPPRSSAGVCRVPSTLRSLGWRSSGAAEVSCARRRTCVRRLH